KPSARADRLIRAGLHPLLPCAVDLAAMELFFEPQSRWTIEVRGWTRRKPGPFLFRRTELARTILLLVRCCRVEMKEPSQLKCSCAYCGQLIDYAVEEAGQVAECPGCKEKSVLPPPPETPASDTAPRPSSRRAAPQSPGANWVVIGGVGLLIFG